MGAIGVLDSGMVTGVGFDAAATCAAIRCGITGFTETGFMYDGEPLQGSPVPYEEPLRGREKLLQMVVSALQECLQRLSSVQTKDIPLLLCVAEEERPGRFAGLDETFLSDVQRRLGCPFHESSALIADGRTGGVRALAKARDLLAEGRPYSLVAGVDTYLVANTLASYHGCRRLKTPKNSDGFIPGEAAAVVTLSRPDHSQADISCLGLGFGSEPATTGSGEPLRADGLVSAIRAALGDSDVGFEQLDFRIADTSGEQIGFKEAVLGLTRTMRVRKPEFDLWHPADCVGEVGAAIVPIVLGVALAATRKAYAPGPGILCHFSRDDSERAVLVLRARREST